MQKQKNVEKKPLPKAALKQVAGGGRTTKLECEEAGMKWSADSKTASDGRGQCKA